jgi:predicted amidophosphoribosyltransferase
MKYCPECEAEYEDGIDTCSDCLVNLISETEYRLRKDEERRSMETLRKADFVSVMIARNAFEADRLKVALEEEGIPVLIRTFLDTAYDGIYVAQKGWGRVEVPITEKERAERIVEDFVRAFPQEEEETEALQCASCGQKLEPEETRCSRCGAPVQS